jgi:zinc protease
MSKNGRITAGDITRLVLPNGIVLLVRENHNTASVSLRGLIKAGGMYETDDKAGLAQFAADALERGTESRTYQEINKTLDGLGATLGVGAGDESTGFYGRCLTEDVDVLLDVLADIVLHPTFPRTEMEKVRGEILTDLQEAENDTQWVAETEFHSALYPAGHPFHRPPEGTKKTVSGITRADLAKFHKTYYRADATIISVVGDLTAGQTAQKIEKVFGGWHATGTPFPYSIPDVRGTTMPLLKKAPVPGKSQADIAFGFPGLARSSPDYHAANVANMIVGVLGLSGRLGDTVRDKQGLAYYIYSSIRAGVGAGPWLVRAGVNPASIDKAIAGIEVELERLRREPVEAQELADAQDYLTGSLALRLETNDGVAGMLLGMEVYSLGLDYLERYDGIIRALTADALLAAAQKYIDLDRRVVIIAGPVPAE